MKVVHVIDHMGLGGEQRVVQDLAVMRAPDVAAAVWSLRSHELPGTADRMAAAGRERHRVVITEVGQTWSLPPGGASAVA